MEAIGELPELAIVPDLLPVLWASPGQAARTIAGGLSSGVFGISHRAVLVNLVARIDPASLPALGEAIGRVDPSLPTIGLAFALADLARLRHQMLTELEPTHEFDRHAPDVQRRSCGRTPSRSSPHELAALAAADDRAAPAELAAVAVGGRHLPARRHAARRHGDHARSTSASGG